MTDISLGVTEAVSFINQTLEAAYPFIVVEGEVASFKVSQNKFVFFDIKDEQSSLGCFMMVFNLKFPIEDGMTVRLVAQPKLTAWGKFSLTVQEITPLGEGSLQKSFELLKAKLEKEGLFDPARKRSLPQLPKRIGIVSSSQAAGFADFIKILNNRWGGLELVLADVAVQGLDAPGQIIRALDYLNELATPLDVIAIIRGGGSKDDLSAFNHEDVVRAVASSRTPTIVGVGHEVDISLADLASDVRAATPSNAAELLVPDKEHVLEQTRRSLVRCDQRVTQVLQEAHAELEQFNHLAEQNLQSLLSTQLERLHQLKRTIYQLNPTLVLKRGYSIVRLGSKVINQKADVTIEDRLAIQFSDGTIKAEVK